MKKASSIPISKIQRASKLVKTGAKVGVNYLKYYGEKMVSSEEDARENLNKNNAEDIYDSLKDMKKYFDNITYICYTTVQPDKDSINDYIKKVKSEVLDETSNLWLIGRMVENIDQKLISEKIRTFISIKDLVDTISY